MTSLDRSAVNVDALAASIVSRDRLDREALRILLDHQMSSTRELPVLTAAMSGTESYLATVTLRWVAGELSFAKDLPLFKEQLTPTGELVIDERTIDEIVQRPLDWTRQLPLAIYLAGRAHHKFPVLLVVMTDDWVDEPYAEEWERIGNDPSQWRARRDATEFTPLDSRRTIGLLEIRGRLFALDGQHRLMGIRGLIELIRDGRIARKRRDNQPTRDTYTREELATTYNFDAHDVERIADERIGIEVIPAVKRGETRAEARRRVKSVFTHVNKHATPLTPGQVAQLDEDDGFSIVARRAAVAHPLLRTTPERARNPRVNWQSSNIANRSTVLTTLQTLTEMTEGYLRTREPFASWNAARLKGLVPVRPDDEELQLAEEEFAELLDQLMVLPSFASLERPDPEERCSTRHHRLFTWEPLTDDARGPRGTGNVLFRPVGQVVLARALGRLVAQGRSLEELLELVAAYESAGGLAIDDPRNPWWGVLYDPIGRKISRGGEDLATDTMEYLLGGAFDALEREDLRERLADKRTVDAGSAGGEEVRAFDGTFAAPADFKLPEPLVP